MNTEVELAKEKIALGAVRGKSHSDRKKNKLEKWMNGLLRETRVNLEERYGDKWKEYVKDKVFEAYFVLGETFLVQTIAILEGNSELFEYASRKREGCLDLLKSTPSDKWFKQISKKYKLGPIALIVT